ncbi:ABC transporter substrate-binding protein [Propionicicella superfundia]|uniref:ABC transporter substrate-binding protein n=1 Tax=Propionicicella superfundia TaxID=348582 RepID=UPI0003F817E3|nr:ABC transporter substrate-binding protein [Propionicicella superfundia]
MAALSALLMALALGGCATNNPLGDATTSPADGARIVVGSANFTESEILAEIYAGALRAKGIDATTQTRIGSREVYLQALKDGSIALVPEYTGNLLQYIDSSSPARTAEEIEKALPEAVGPDLAILDPSAATDQDVYVVTKTLADAEGLVSLRDLSDKASDWVLGGPSELEGRPYGPQGLTDVYNVTFKQFKAYNSQAVKIKDLQDDKIQVATFFTTDAALAGDEFVQLADPEMMILPQNVVPLAAASVAQNSTATDAINAVQAALTTSELLALNRSVDTDHRSAADVAAEWLSGKGLG